MAKNRIYNFIIAICVIGVIAGSVYLLPKLFEQYKAEDAFSKLRSKEIDLEALHKKNKDLIGWIKIKGTKIDYPVMQSKYDPQFYLRHNFKKQYSESGTPFMDSFSTMGETRNYLVYGHNMKTGLMFHDLVKYDSNKFFKKHKYINFDTLREGKAKYEIVAAFKTETYNFPYFHYADIKTIKTYNKYVEKIKAWNQLKTKVNLKIEKDQLLTLSTCSYHVSDRQGRMVIVAKKLVEESDRDLNEKWETMVNKANAEKEWKERISEGAEF